MKAFDFKSDLESKGKPGEARFKELFPIELTGSSTYAVDFITTELGETIEVKTDYYKNTPNFFMERYSSGDKDGGPWQSKADYFIYWYINQPELGFFIFKTSELVELLNELIKGKQFKAIPNKGYITTGYALNRELFNHILYETV